MPWFKVDDGLHAHRKVARAGIDAMGLWVVAGSWCADQLTDGFIPDYMARKLDPDFEVHAASLVAAKLWIPGEKDDETGWWFHQWSEEGRQPTAESVNAKRDEARERMAKLRAERAEAAKNKEKRSQDVRANTVRTSQEVASTPTRPDPTRTSISNEIEEEPSSAAPPPLALLAGASGPDLFDEFWDAYPRHVGKAKARTTFATKVKNGADPTAVIAAARSYADRCRATRQDPQFIPHPTTWLNRESWTDDLDEALPPAATGTGGYQPYQNRPDRDYHGSI